MNPDFTPPSQISGNEKLSDGEYSQELENQHRDYSKLLRYRMLGVLGLMLAVGVVFVNNSTKTEDLNKESYCSETFTSYNFPSKTCRILSGVADLHW